MFESELCQWCRLRFSRCWSCVDASGVAGKTPLVLELVLCQCCFCTIVGAGVVLMLHAALSCVSLVLLSRLSRRWCCALKSAMELALELESTLQSVLGKKAGGA